MIKSRPFTFISNAYFFQAYMLLLTSTVIVARQHLAGNTNRPTSQARNTKKENFIKLVKVTSFPNKSLFYSLFFEVFEVIFRDIFCNHYIFNPQKLSKNMIVQSPLVIVDLFVSLKMSTISR